jgi:hypothetical protein
VIILACYDQEIPAFDHTNGVSQTLILKYIPYLLLKEGGTGKGHLRDRSRAPSDTTKGGTHARLDVDRDRYYLGSHPAGWARYLDGVSSEPQSPVTACGH